MLRNFLKSLNIGFHLLEALHKRLGGRLAPLRFYPDSFAHSHSGVVDSVDHRFDLRGLEGIPRAVPSPDADPIAVYVDPVVPSPYAAEQKGEVEQQKTHVHGRIPLTLEQREGEGDQQNERAKRERCPRQAFRKRYREALAA